MPRSKLRFLSALVLCAAFWLPAAAQSVSGKISGTVVDDSGRVLAGATVTLINERTNDARNVTTNDSGDFIFNAIQPGYYTVKVEQRGFSVFQQQGIVLTATEHRSVGEVQLKVGQLTETVTTVAEGTPVQTESTEHSALITSKQIDQISIRGRDVTALLRVLPGVSYQGQSESAGNGFGSGIPNIQGGRNTQSTINVDGLRGNDLGSPSTFSSTVNFDAIGEVKVLLNSYQAEYATNSAASINVITKSGTSQYHGGGYWYKRHEQFNAQNFFNNLNRVNKPRYRFSTLGATLGGPVWLPKIGDKIKDKLFFFYSFEDSQTLNPQALRTVTVPTAAERSGDFSKSFLGLNSSGVPNPVFIRDPLKTGNCTATDKTACFDNNIVPANRINKNGQALLNVLPQPNALDLNITRGNYNYTFQESIKIPKRQNLFRVDYKPSEKNTFYVRGSTWFADNQGIAVPAGTANWGLAGLHYTYTDNGITGNWTRLISSQIVNEATLGVRHGVEKGPPLNDAELAKLQRKTYGFSLGQFFPALNPLNIIPQVTFNNITNAANITYDGRTPLRGADTLITFNDTISYTKGAHIMKAGFYAERARNYEGATSTFAGAFVFQNDLNNPLNSGYSYANALLGNFQQYTESNSRPSGEGRQSIVEWFVQDSWKATRRLTIEAGVRFAWFNQWYQSNNKASIFSIERYDPKKAPKLYAPTCAVPVAANETCAAANRRALNPVNGQILPAVFIGGFVPNSGDPYNGMVLATDKNYPRGFRNQQPVQVQPRFGFAWDVKGDGKLAIRGNVGVFNQTRVSANAVWNDVSRNPPITDTPRILYGNMDNLLSSSGTLFPASVASFELEANTPVTYNYSLGVQKDIGWGTVVDIAYVGSQSRHLQQARNINALPYGTNFLKASQDATRYPGGIVPDAQTGLRADYVAAGLKFNGATVLPADFLRPYAGYTNITYFENAGTANYNGLQVALNRRFTRGVQFGIAYTYSKTMDYADDDRSTVATYRPLRIWNYGRAGFDQTHVFVLNYTWDLPRASNLMNNIVVKSLFDNWQLSGLTAFASGTPSGVGFSTVDGVDITGGGDGARIVLTGNPLLDRGSRKNAQLSNGLISTPVWFNTSVFARPTPGNFGNAPKDVFRLPGTANFDLSLFKNIPLGNERRYLQFRWELYNVFNHTQWSGVNSTAQFSAPDANGVVTQTNPNFGLVTAAREPRYMQLSLRLTF
ncbi:MAG: carboxypeptidase regulatory-like domain-containing protein [Acidobacteria bacterium]|nr:carboxypeptidase regulatory-like domain-containing protein [Acidobacteriota bacterium]